MCVDAARLHYPSGVYVVSSGRKPLNRMHDILAPGGVFVLFDFAQRAKRFTPVPPRRLLRDFDVSFTEHILNHAYQMNHVSFLLLLFTFGLIAGCGGGGQAFSFAGLFFS